MAAPSPEDIGKAFREIDGLRIAATDLDKRTSFNERDIQDLKSMHRHTEAKVVTMEAAILGKLDQLFEDKNIQKGRGQVITWVPTVITCIIGIAAIISIIRG